METKRITSALNGWLDQYRKLPQIIDWLDFLGIKITEREFADYVEEYRKEDHEFYLESCSKGYRFTRDNEAINKSISQRFKKALSMINHCKRDWKNLSEKEQLSLLNEYSDDALASEIMKVVANYNG